MITIYERATDLLVTGEPDEISELVRLFRFRPDGHFFALSFQRWQVSEGEEGWDGYIYPLFKINSTSAKCGRGRRDDVIKHAELLNYQLDLSHLLPVPFGELEVDDVPPDCIAGDFQLDNNQRQCICDWLRSGIGLNKVTVGGGKTAQFAGAAAMIKSRYPDARFLYITPSERLVRQATKDMKGFLPDFEIGQCGGGHRDFDAKDMVVCTVAMLNKHFISLKNKGWFDTFISILYDECVTGDARVTRSDGTFECIQSIAESGQCVGVKSYNEATGAIEDKLARGMQKGTREIVVVSLHNDVNIRCTPEHLVFTMRGWVSAGSLTCGDYILYADERARTVDIRKPVRGCLDGHRRPLPQGGVREDNAPVKQFIKVRSVGPAGREKVYDLTVDDNHNYFANGCLVHNCHHAGSPSSIKLLNAIPAYFRLGASDTSKEKDPSRFNSIRGLFGPMLNDIKSAPLIESGRLAKPHIYIVDVPEWKGRFSSLPHRPVYNSPAYALIEGDWVQAKYAGPVYALDEEGKVKTKSVKQAEKDANDEWIYTNEPVVVAGLHKLEIDGVEHEIESSWCLLERMYDRAVISFKSRNKMIVEWAKYFHRKGWPTVVVATRTTHVYILEALLTEAVPKDMVKVMTGEASPKERDATFEWLKNTPGAVLISPLVKEGVSINAIRSMIVADSVADIEVARQIIGRAMRPKKTGENRASVVWFWDRQHPVLSRTCRQLFGALEKQDGFEYYHPCAGPETVFPEDFKK